MHLGNPLEEKAKKFVENKGQNQFLLCEYILNINLPKWLRRQKVILFEFNQKVQNEEYELFSSKQAEILIPKDKIIVKQFVLNYNESKNKNAFAEDINKIFNLLHMRINYFIKKYIDERIILEVNFDLKSCLFSFLTPNDSDAQTLASAIQEHNRNKLTIMTSDKQDWTEDLLKEVHNDPKLVKEFPLLPKIEYLQDYG